MMSREARGGTHTMRRGIRRFHAAAILKSKARLQGRNPEVKVNDNELDYQPRAATAI